MNIFLRFHIFSTVVFSQIIRDINFVKTNMSKINLLKIINKKNDTLLSYTKLYKNFYGEIEKILNEYKQIFKHRIST